MAEITDEIEDKLNDIGVGLSEIQRLSRIMQACFDDNEELDNGDLKTIFKFLKSRIIEVKKDFSNIQAELQI